MVALRPAEVELIAAEQTRELAGAVVQKVSAPTSSRVYLDVRVPGRTETLLVCADDQAARLCAVEERPPNPPTPPGWQSVLRRELDAARLVDVEAQPSRGLVLMHFRDRPTLLLELNAGACGIALINRDRRILACSRPWREGVRVGGVWEPPPERPVDVSKPSRLSGDRVSLRLSHAAHQLFADDERARWVRTQVGPLEAKLKRILRTQEKVKADANRLGDAQTFRREGELLTRNLHLLQRGVTSVTLTDYLDDGSVVERVVTLDPSRTPKQEAERRFHQYRRLTRGAELAVTRLSQLEQEAQAVRAQLEAAKHAQPPAGPPAKKTTAEPRARVFREYVGHGGRRVWVGKGGAHNDTLTFRHAKPHHLWLHVRGLPGAHVVVPLEKGETISGELLIDAALLAAHHSDAKGAPKTEVSYVLVRQVRKPRDSGPGAVVYTGEKTLLLRVEPERLRALLATEVLD